MEAEKQKIAEIKQSQKELLDLILKKKGVSLEKVVNDAALRFVGNHSGRLNAQEKKLYNNITKK